MNYLDYAVSILSGLAVCIPLVVCLVRYVRQAIRTNAWDKLLRLVMADMTAAETLYTTGAERKAYVMALADVNAATVGYPLDDAARSKVSDMIDAMCALSKAINVEVGSPK